MTRLWAIIAASVAVLGLGATLLFVMRAPAERFAECRRMQIAGNVQLGGPFTLVDETGATVTDADVITEPTLIYFGYTFCPDVCPLDTVRNAEAVDVLAEDGISATPVMITVDPGRDTPEAMDDFTANIHPKFLGLTGSDEQIATVAKAYRALYSITDPDDEFYLVNHSAFTYFVAPEVGFLTVFDRALSGEQMADQMRCYTEKL